MKKEKRGKEMSSDYSARAAKGQAFNLAVHEAVKSGKENDKRFIYSRFVYYYELGKMVQDFSVDDIKRVLDE